MAVCNLFNRFDSASGNFLMFSQYVEDITHNYVETENWKVIPTKFIALNIDYSKIDKSLVLPNNEDLNIGIPKYFQNCFENACAYGRENYAAWAEKTSGIRTKTWTPEISRNLFWNSMFDGGFLHTSSYGDTKQMDEVVYYGNINMHSYNEHKGMGYGEIYCYIPTDAEKKQCQVICITDSELDGRKSEIPENYTNLLEGHSDKYIENYRQEYFYNRDFSMSFDDTTVGELLNSTSSSYDINTIVVLYSIFKKFNDTWKVEYENIPLGMYFTGRFEGEKLTNTVTKYVTTSYGTGTSYGVRICTRFSVLPNGSTILKNSEIIADDSNYTNLNQLMTAMNENLSKMLDVCKSAQDTTNQYKEIISMMKNNKVNVPYVKDINGSDYWFVNGKFVSAVAGSKTNNGCTELSNEIIQKRISNLMDNDPTNDWTAIDDGTGCECTEATIEEIINKIKGLNPDFEFDEYENITPEIPSTESDYEIANDEDIADELIRYI